MKLANILAPLSLLATLAAAEPTLHTLETTCADTSRQVTNWFLPAGYRVKVQTLAQAGGVGNVVEWTSQRTGATYGVLPGMTTFVGPGRFYLRSTREGFTSNPRQLLVLEMVESPAPTLAVVERSEDLTNWVAVGQVWLQPDAAAPQLFYRLNLPPADVR